MARDFASVTAGTHAADPVHLWLQSSGGTILLLICMIFMSFSVLSFVIFACAGGSSSGKGGGGGGGCGGGCGGGGCGG
ncbi:hypothetical protein TIFTF001_032711 [Ficus carica]|uniref:Uncharacterized protein n=1 Tax=Ficus carica TaxID=3494 RepID=A0AA88DX56_FICCA|nr:hypothetical protein TIFTF001_032711 [Ficus carica]